MKSVSDANKFNPIQTDNFLDGYLGAIQDQIIRPFSKQCTSLLSAIFIYNHQI